jgi:exopolysaccharide production protein ExoZ
MDQASYTAPSHPCGWTIAFEVWFYLLFATFLLNRSYISKLYSLLAVALVSVLVSIGYGMSWFTPRFMSCPLLLEFLGGCALGLVVERIRSGWACVCLALSLLLYVFVVPLFGELTYYDRVIVSSSLSLWRVAVWGIPAILFCAAISSLELHGHLKVPAFLVLLGNSSYSIYLAQPFFIGLMSKVSHSSIGITFLCFLCFSIMAGVLLSKFVEYPILAYFSKLQKRLRERWTSCPV